MLKPFVLPRALSALVFILAANTSVRADFTITAKANPNFSFGSPNAATNGAGVSLPGSNPSATLDASGIYQDVSNKLAPGLNSGFTFANLQLDLGTNPSGVDSYTNSPTYFDYFITIANTNNPLQTATYDVSGPIGGNIDASDPTNIFNNLFIATNPPVSSDPLPTIVQLSGDSYAFDLSNIGISDGAFDAGSGTMTNHLTLDIKVKAAPEPASMTLLGLGGLGALRLLRRRRSRTRAAV